MEITNAIKVFFSYAQEDQKLRDEFDKHLGALKRSGHIVTWHNRAIQAGMNWKDEVDAHLGTSDLILLLISNHFMASDYCYGQELRYAIERHDAGKARVFPIILSPVDWENTPISKLQVSPDNGKPITLWRSRDPAFLKVVQEIREVVNTLSQPSEARSPIIEKQHLFTIDTHEAIGLFHQLMRSGTEHRLRILYLTGETFMGKSRLMKKVFPVMAKQDYHARCIMFDLRNPIQNIPEILHLACEQVGGENCRGYYKVLQEVMSHPKREETLPQILLNIASPPLSDTFMNDIALRNKRLTTQFLMDLSELQTRPIIFFFDTVDCANEDIQSWLIQTFLAKLSLLPHVRVVIADRILPEPPEDFRDFFQAHLLNQVKDEKEYVTYCQQRNVPLVQQSIRSLAHDCEYTPGLFATQLLMRFYSTGG